MAPITLVLEGTWEEIAVHQADFAGRRLRVQVLPMEERSGDPRLQVLQDIEARSRSMNPRPDDQDYLREGRASLCKGL